MQVQMYSKGGFLTGMEGECRQTAYQGFGTPPPLFKHKLCLLWCLMRDGEKQKVLYLQLHHSTETQRGQRNYPHTAQHYNIFPHLEVVLLRPIPNNPS